MPADSGLWLPLLEVGALFAGVASAGDSRYEAGVALALFGGCKVADDPCPSPAPSRLWPQVIVCLYGSNMSLQSFLP